MDAEFVGQREVAVLSAGEGDGFAIGELQAVSGDEAEATFGCEGEQGVGTVGDFSFACCGGFVSGIAERRVVFCIQHAAGCAVLCADGGFLFVQCARIGLRAAHVRSDRDGLVRSGDPAGVADELPGLFEQRDGCGGVACRFAGGLGDIALNTPCREQRAVCGTYCAVAVGAQLEAVTAMTAAVVVGLMNEMTEIQLTGRLGRGELNALLVVAVVKHKLAVGSAGGVAVFRTLETAEGRAVAMRAVATDVILIKAMAFVTIERRAQ